MSHHDGSFGTRDRIDGRADPDDRKDHGVPRYANSKEGGGPAMREAVRAANRADIELAMLFADDPSIARIQAIRKTTRPAAIKIAHTVDVMLRMPNILDLARDTGHVSVHHGGSIWTVANEYAEHFDRLNIMTPGRFDVYLANHVMDIFVSRPVHYPTPKELEAELRKIIAVEFPVAFGEGEREKESQQSATKVANTWRLQMPKVRSQELWELVNREARLVSEATGQDMPAARMTVIADRIAGEVPASWSAHLNGVGATNPADLDNPTGTTDTDSASPATPAVPTRAVTTIHMYVFRLPEGPGFIAGAGVISREEADHLQFRADTIGHVERPASRAGYAPSPAQKSFVAGRDGCCRFPGCDIPATLCDKDHIVPYNHDTPEAGGLTDVGNLQSLCRTHHNLKTNGFWNASTPDGGHTIIWINAHGEAFRTLPQGLIAGATAGVETEWGAEEGDQPLNLP